MDGIIARATEVTPSVCRPDQTRPDPHPPSPFSKAHRGVSQSTGISCSSIPCSGSHFIHSREAKGGGWADTHTFSLERSSNSVEHRAPVAARHLSNTFAGGAVLQCGLANAILKADQTGRSHFQSNCMISRPTTNFFKLASGSGHVPTHPLLLPWPLRASTWVPRWSVNTVSVFVILFKTLVAALF